MFSWRALWLAMLTSVLVCAADAQGQSAVAFRWITPQEGGDLWSSVQDAFHGQLKASDPDYAQLNYGYLARIGAVDDAALVIIGHKAGEHPQGDWNGVERFSIYNYNLVTARSSEVAGLRYVWFWKFVKVARLDSSAIPDVVFTYYPCWECDAPQTLSTLMYDTNLHQWQLRQWTGPKDWNTQTALFVGEGGEPGDNIVSSDNLYGLVNLGHDALEDVALRSRWVTKAKGNRFRVDDWTLVYGVRNGRFIGRVVSNKQEKMKIWSKLCVNAHNKLCKNVPTVK